ncbi:phasin family protein [bacterium]|nr:phasin family protein [bacterium]
MATNKTANNFGNFPDYSKMFAEFRLPSVDFTSFFNIQRRNMEAFSAAHQVLAESFQALSRRQAELMQEQLEGVLKNAKDVLGAGSPEAGAAKQADYAKHWMANSFNNFRELAEMASKSNVEVLDVISNRVVKNIEEFGEAVKKAA